MRNSVIGREHAPCVEHLLRNANARPNVKINQSTRVIVYRAAKATNSTEFHLAMSDLKIVNENAWEFFMELSQPWALTMSDSPRFGDVTSNAVESMNSAFLEIRRQPIFFLVRTMLLNMARRYNDYKNYAINSSDTLSKFAKNIIDKNIELGNTMNVENMETTYLVNDAVNGDVVVTPRNGEALPFCSCGIPQEYQLPCAHVSATMDRATIYNTAANFYSIAHMKQMFGCFFEFPAFTGKLLPSDRKILPPMMESNPGRQRTQRIRSRGELNATSIYFTRSRRSLADDE